MAAGERADVRGERRERAWLLISGSVLILGGIAVQVFTGRGSSSTLLGHPSPWRENLSFAVVVVAVVLIVISLVQAVRARAFSAARRERAWTLSIGQHRQMGRWIRRGQAAEGDMVQATAAAAARLARQGKTMLFFVGFALMLVGAALGATNLWRLAYMVYGAAMMVVCAVLARRDANLAQRWLDGHQHTADAAPPAASR